MSSRPTFCAFAAALAVLGTSACKTVYSDTFSYSKNGFQPPVVKQPEIKMPTEVLDPLKGATPDGVLPGGLAPDPGMPAIPGGEAAPGIPGIPMAPVPGAPAAPAIPGLN